MYSESPWGEVTITLNFADYQSLLVTLGYAIGAAVKENEPQIANHMVKLANTINEGNPQWHPYRVV